MASPIVTAALVPLPAPARAAGLPEEELEGMAGLRPLDPTSGARIVAPGAGRARIRAALETGGYALLVEGQPLPEGTVTAGLAPDKAARFRGVPLDVYAPRPDARPLHAALGSGSTVGALADRARV